MTEEAKPATDAQIAVWRLKYKAANGFYGTILSSEVGPLISRIDDECAARLAAEARVRVLEEAIDKFIDATRQECCGRGVGYGEAPECCGQPDLLVDCQALDDLCNSRAALKEPANG